MKKELIFEVVITTELACNRFKFKTYLDAEKFARRIQKEWHGEVRIENDINQMITYL